jgi:hypothetical protein
MKYISTEIEGYVGVLISLWLSKGILFLQDNAAPHKAAITHQKLADLHIEVLKHPAYSPDLVPSYYYLFIKHIISPLVCLGKGKALGSVSKVLGCEPCYEQKKEVE